MDKSEFDLGIKNNYNNHTKAANLFTNGLVC